LNERVHCDNIYNKISRGLRMVFLPDDGRGESGYLEAMLSNFSASYKLYWFKGLLEEVLEGKREIAFSSIVHKMISYAWYPVLYYNLNLGKADLLADTVRFLAKGKDFQISMDSTQKEIIGFLNECKDNEVREKAKNFENMVPYRLVRPFFEKEIAVAKQSGLKDHQVNRLIEDLSKKTPLSLYEIERESGKLLVNEEWAKYLIKNEALIKGWLNYKLVDYLQKRNPSIPAIPYKIFPPEKRDLREASNIFKKVLRYSEMKDIFTDLPFNNDNQVEHGGISIDHFIPWSFVLHDELWNLCPTFKNINSEKGNKIPQMKYIDKFSTFQYQTFIAARREHVSEKELESYLTIKNDIFSIVEGQDKGREVFENAIKNTINPLYQIAYNHGYELWLKY
jgi:hypothetical protein